MTTVLVWVLIVFSDGYKSESAVAVDNIATLADCERLGKRAVIAAKRASYGTKSYTCTQVRKVVVR